MLFVNNRTREMYPRSYGADFDAIDKLVENLVLHGFEGGRDFTVRINNYNPNDSMILFAGEFCPSQEQAYNEIVGSYKAFDMVHEF